MGIDRLPGPPGLATVHVPGATERSVLTAESPYSRISECEGNFYKAAFSPKTKINFYKSAVALKTKIKRSLMEPEFAHVERRQDEKER
jgi:hypothetical protein